jgi:hypothetical protein
MLSLLLVIIACQLGRLVISWLSTLKRVPRTDDEWIEFFQAHKHCHLQPPPRNEEEETAMLEAHHYAYLPRRSRQTLTHLDWARNLFLLDLFLLVIVVAIFYHQYFVIASANVLVVTREEKNTLLFGQCLSPSNEDPFCYLHTSSLYTPTTTTTTSGNEEQKHLKRLYFINEDGSLLYSTRAVDIWLEKDGTTQPVLLQRLIDELSIVRFLSSQYSSCVCPSVLGLVDNLFFLAYESEQKPGRHWLVMKDVHLQQQHPHQQGGGTSSFALLPSSSTLTTTGARVTFTAGLDTTRALEHANYRSTIRLYRNNTPVKDSLLLRRLTKNDLEHLELDLTMEQTACMAHCGRPS